MKLSLDIIGYGGYFTQDGEALSVEDSVRRAATFGYDAACIYAHRPLGFPLDFDQDRKVPHRHRRQELLPSPPEHRTRPPPGSASLCS